MVLQVYIEMVFVLHVQIWSFERIPSCFIMVLYLVLIDTI